MTTLLSLLLVLAGDGEQSQGLLASALARGTKLLYVAPPAADTMVWPVDSVHRTEFERRTGAVRVFFGPRGTNTPASERIVWADERLQYEWNAATATWVAQRPIAPNDSLRFSRPNGDIIVYRTGARTVEHVGGVPLTVVETTVTTFGADGRERRRLVEGYSPEIISAVRGEFSRPDPATAGARITDQRFHLAGLAR
jgi:hypothetical protein